MREKEIWGGVVSRANESLAPQGVTGTYSRVDMSVLS